MAGGQTENVETLVLLLSTVPARGEGGLDGGPQAGLLTSCSKHSVSGQKCGVVLVPNTKQRVLIHAVTIHHTYKMKQLIRVGKLKAS